MIPISILFDPYKYYFRFLKQNFLLRIITIDIVAYRIIIFRMLQNSRLFSGLARSKENVLDAENITFSESGIVGYFIFLSNHCFILNFIR